MDEIVDVAVVVVLSKRAGNGCCGDTTTPLSRRRDLEKFKVLLLKWALSPLPILLWLKLQTNKQKLKNEKKMATFTYWVFVWTNWVPISLRIKVNPFSSHWSVLPIKHKVSKRFSSGNWIDLLFLTWVGWPVRQWNTVDYYAFLATILYKLVNCQWVDTSFAWWLLHLLRKKRLF